MKIAFFQRSVLILLFFFLVISGLYLAKGFFIPIILSTLLAMVLLPMNRWLEKKGLPRILAIVLSLLTIIAIILGISFLFYTQIALFSEDLPLFKSKIIEKFEEFRIFIESKTSISATQQMDWIKKRYTDALNSSGQYISMILMGVTGALATFGIVIVYILFILLYRARIREFILKLTPPEKQDKVVDIIGKVINLTQHYLIGLLIELTVLGTLNAIGLLIIGVRQAIFLGYLAGLLNIIPYIGTLIGSLFPILITLIFKDNVSSVIAVIVVMAVNQFIDNNFLTPKIIGSHVKLNPLVTIMMILIGGLLWGVAGMILFIPMLGMVKIICDNISWLEPFGYLMGDDEEEENISNKPKFLFFIRNIFSTKK